MGMSLEERVERLERLNGVALEEPSPLFADEGLGSLTFGMVMESVERHYEDPEPVKRVLAEAFRLAEMDYFMRQMKAMSGRPE